jgi:hypothetical protein
LHEFFEDGSNIIFSSFLEMARGEIKKISGHKIGKPMYL